jgi:hypothetical protein
MHVRRDSVEGIVWAVFAGGEGAPVEERAPGKTIEFFLAGGRASVTVFQNLATRPVRRFMRAGMALVIRAKRKGGQAIENKQLREMAYFAPIMILTAYGPARETARFARRKNPFAFAGFSASSRAKTQGSEISGGFGARGGRSAARRLGNGAASPCMSVRGSSLMFGRARFVLVEP